MHLVGSGVIRRWWATPLAAVVMVLCGTSSASAHTGFESSDPEDGETIGQPVAEITLTFSGEATPVGEGFVILDPSGTIRQPDEAASTDNLTWTLRFDEPLSGGAVGVRWHVVAPDAHPIDGSFSFVAGVEPAAEELTDAPSPTADATPETTAPSPSAPTTAPAAVSESAASPPPSDEPDRASVDLETFLDNEPDTALGAPWLSRLSRVLELVGAVGAIGGAVFAARVLRGSTREVRTVLYWVRRAGALLVVGAAGAMVAQVATVQAGWSGLWSPRAWTDTLWSSHGLAVALRFAAGALIMTGTKFDLRAATAIGDPVIAAKQLTSVGSGPGFSRTSPSVEPAATPPSVRDGDHAWHPRASPAALVGLALVAASFLFDGHTASEGPRWLHATANLIHVVTAATWAGGVAMLAMVIARRHRNHVATRSLELAVRFSVVATVALVAAGIAGAVLSAVILDSPSELWSTAWGRLLLVKVALVAVAAAGGAYNHNVMVPALDQSDDDAVIAHRFRNVVTLEAVTLVAVTLTTALLVAASTN